MPSVRIHINTEAGGSYTGVPATGASLAYHKRLPGYAATPLHSLPVTARRLGIGNLLVKDESQRLGLPAFKILGASYAVFRLVCRFLGQPSGTDLATLKKLLRSRPPVTLITASDGNHGRAVARAARWWGMGAHIFMPAGTVPARVQAIADEGALVEVISGPYDQAVSRAALEQGPLRWLVQDTAWPGYEQVPAWIVAGYETLCLELKEQLQHQVPDIVVVQIGVGSLAQAVCRFFRHYLPDCMLVGVEPVSAACGLASLAAGASIPVDTARPTIMAGLQCGTLSSLAWPVLHQAMHAAIACGDAYAEQAVKLLHREGLDVGESGAAGVAAVLALRDEPASAGNLPLERHSRVLCLATEGPTDPRLHQRLLYGTP